jgi:hypothetical protein
VSAITEIQAIVDTLQQEGHTIATRLENALKDIVAHFTKDASALGGEAAADVAKIEADAAPVEAEAVADVKTIAAEAKADATAEVAADIADLKGAAKK